MFWVIIPTGNLSQDLFLTQLELVVKKKMKVKITRTEGWFAESELRLELKWSPSETHFLKIKPKHVEQELS